MRPLRPVSALGVTLLAFATLGCGGKTKDDSGVLVAPYELGNRKDCKSLGVVSVRAELDDGAVAQEVECDAGEVRFNLLKPGHYDVVVYGLNADGVRVMDSLADGPTSVDVVGGGTTVIVDPAVKLTAAPAKLALRWNLGFGSCESSSIGSFALDAWRSDGSDLLMQTEVLCSMQGQGREQYRLVPDKQRALSGEELGEVNVQAKDVHGIAMGKPVTFNFDSPGPGREVKLSLSCGDGGCKGSGQPD
jgi:hypothetical protein